MEKYIYLNELYDYYKDFLTTKQKLYFEEYYQNNLSLSEISENYNVSRNAVHNQLKACERKLIEYEEILKLFNKKKEIIVLLENKIDKKLFEKIQDLI